MTDIFRHALEQIKLSYIPRLQFWMIKNSSGNKNTIYIKGKNCKKYF